MKKMRRRISIKDMRKKMYMKICVHERDEFG